MQINFIQGANYSSAPSWLTGAGGVLDQVQSFYDHLFTNNITINITLNWTPLAWTQTSTHEGGTLASNNLTSGTQEVTSSLSAVTNALIAHEGNAIQAEAYANLPTSGISTVDIGPAEAMALGLETKQTVNIYVDVNSSANWLGGGGFSPLDAFAAIAHEITETAMGRFSNPGSSTVDVMDLFRFSAPGQHDLTSGATSSSTVNSSAYFSINGGVTNLGTWPNDPGHGDYGDWLQGQGPIANDAYGTTGGGVAPISEVDIELMNVLGWGVAAVTSGVTSVVTGGHTFSGYTVMSGGVFDVQSGGVASNTYYTDAQGFADGVIMAASSGGHGGSGYIHGEDIGATVDGGGLQYVESDGEAFSAKILSNGSQTDYGLTENTVLSGGYEGVAASAHADYTSVMSGGTFHLDSRSQGFGDVVLSGGSETVWGLSEAETISAYGSQTVSSGGTDEFSTISGIQTVYGTTSGDTVKGGPSEQYVKAGGVVVGDVLVAEGYATISSGGYASGGSISSGGVQLVYAHGSASATTVDSGGNDYVYSGGVEYDTSISGGRQTIETSGGILGGKVYSAGLQTVYGQELGLTVNNAGSAVVGDGGLVAIGSVSAGGNLVVDQTGSASDITLYSAGSETVSFGGVDVSATVSSGGSQILSGGTASGATILGQQYVDSGGVAVGDVISSGGVDFVLSNGAVSSTTVDAGGTEYIVDAHAFSTTVSGASASQFVADGGVTSDTQVGAGGTQYVTEDFLFQDGVPNGSAISTTVSGGGVLTVAYGGVAFDATIDGSLNVSSGGAASGAIIGLTAIDTIGAGGVVVSTTLTGFGAEEFVQSGGVASDTIVDSEARQYVESGGSAFATDIQAVAVIDSGGRITRAMVVGNLYLYGSATGDTISRGATQTVSSGGVAVGDILLAGGVEAILSGGVMSNAGPETGKLELLSGGTVSGVAFGAGGVDLLYAGGIQSGVTISSGGILELAHILISSGATVVAEKVQSTTVISGASLLSGAILETYSATVLSGGSETIGAGGVAVGTVVSSGGVLAVSSGGLLSNAGPETGKLEVLSGGTASGVAIGAGGVDLLYAGGIESGVTVSSGGVLELARLVIGAGAGVVAEQAQAMTAVSGASLLSGAILETYSATILSGGSETVSAGGVAVGTVVSGGGALTVASGGAVAGGLTLSGGTATISGSVAGGQTVRFIGSGGALALDNLAAFSGQIAGLGLSGQRIDLGGFAYSSTGETRSWSEAASNTSGTLTITDGGKVATLNLLGLYTTSNFTLSDDGHGGTYVVDPAVGRFAQAMAVIGGGPGAPGGSLYSATTSFGAFAAPALIPMGTSSAAGHA